MLIHKFPKRFTSIGCNLECIKLTCYISGSGSIVGLVATKSHVC